MELPIAKLQPPSNPIRQVLSSRITEYIVEALNGAKPAIDRELQKRLIDLQKLEEIVQALYESPSRPIRTGTDCEPYWGWPLAKFDDPKTEALNREGSAIAHRLNRKLRRMRQHVMVVNYQYKKLETIVVPVCKKNNREGLLALYTERIIFYMRLGELWRLRQCKSCKKWFFAKAQHQKFHSAACRMRYVSDSDEFREKRARYMRERYRPQEKEREGRATQLGRRSK